VSFATYKKNRTDLTQINKKVDEIQESKSNSFKDSRFWGATVDKDLNGSARLRFCPAPEGEDLPWVQYHEHRFEVDGSWYVELCPTTLGRDCPVCKFNGILWKTEIKENKAIVSSRKRKLVYIANLVVLKDKEVPENEGKVFLYKFGQKIFEKIKMALKPKDEDDPAVNVFDFWEGADFNLEIKKVADFRNYDDSKFRVPSPLFQGDDDLLEKVYHQLHKLQPFVEEKKFKSYEELEKKFNDVVGGVKGKIQKKADELFQDSEKPAVKEPEENKTRKPQTETATAPPWEEVAKKTTEKKTTKKTKKTTEVPEEVPVESENALDFYNKLVEED